MWYTFGEVRPRVGRNVLLRLWERFYAAKYTGHDWHLILSGETIRADVTDEWTSLS
jgi:hypothetical protein